MSSFKLIGTVHLKALPGSPGAEHNHPAEVLQQVGFNAVQEAHHLAQCGFDAVILQNYGDLPHFQSLAPSDTVASMAIIAAAVREAVRINIGIQMMEADARSALSIAAVTGCDFIRVPLSSGRNEIATLLRERARLHSPVDILAQMDTYSHAPPEIQSQLDLLRWMEGMIVSRHQGEWIRSQSIQTPLYLELDARRGEPRSEESTLEFIREHRSALDGVILGVTLRKGNSSDGALELKRAREWVRELKKSHRQTTGKKKKSKSRKK